jgi:pyridoxine 4-dehydrogenase
VQVHAQLADRGVRLASAQVQLSLLSWGPMQRDLVATAQELGVTVIAYSPLALGLLSGKYASDLDAGTRENDGVPKGPRGQLFKQLIPSSRPVRAALREIARERGVSESQVCPL